MVDKVGKVMGEFDKGKLHSGSPKGPVVESRAQAIAIGLSEARKAGQSVPPDPQSHGYGHSIGQRSGKHRTSGHPKAHRIGKR